LRRAEAGNENTFLVMAHEDDLALHAKQQQYLDWLCTAPSERNPATKQGFADHVGVDVTTLRRWEKKDVFAKEWEQRARTVQGSPERTQSVLDTLHARAMDGDVRAAQLWLQAMDKMAPAQVEVKTDRQAAQLSDAELDELIGAMAARERDSRLKAV
jgi:hypothetical protein